MTEEPLKCEGVTLRTTILRESDVIATILTSGEGKLRALARGARASKRRFFGGMDILEYAEFEILPVASKTKLSTSERLPLIIGRRPLEAWPGLRTNLKVLALATFALDLVDSITVEGVLEVSELFTPLVTCLRFLASSQPESMNSLHPFAELCKQSLDHAGIPANLVEDGSPVAPANGLDACIAMAREAQRCVETHLAVPLRSGAALSQLQRKR